MTIFGEDTGWANVAFQLTTYSGRAKSTFQKAILISGPTTGSQKLAAKKHVADLIGVLNSSSPTNSSAAELTCLRNLPLATLTNAAVEYAFAFDPLAGVGTFKPTAPSSFITSSLSHLLRTGQTLKNISYLIGWCEDDGTQFVAPTLNSTSAFTSWVLIPIPCPLSPRPRTHFAVPDLRLLELALRVHFACPSLLLADAYSNSKTGVYLWALNATVFRVGHALHNRTFVGQDHFSDILYVFSFVDQPPYLAVADQSDHDLLA